MRFRLLSNSELLGYSDLELADPSMGGRAGRFMPHENYSKYQNLFRAYSEVRFNTNVDEKPSHEYEKLKAQIDSLHLRIETNDEREIGTAHIVLEDFSEELGTDGYELDIVVDDRRTYIKFFE